MVILSERKEKSNPEKSFTLFPSNYGTEMEEEISKDDLIRYFREGRWKTQVEAVRKALQKHGRDSDEHKAAKKVLPSVALSVFCSSRSKNKTDAEKFLAYNYLYQVDMDIHKSSEVVREVREQLSHNPHIAFAAISPSGDGVKAAIKFSLPEWAEELLVDDDSLNRLLRPIHKSACEEINDYLAETYRDQEIKNDKAVKDPFRICFVLYDPDIYYNPNAVPLQLTLDEYRKQNDQEEKKISPTIIEDKTIIEKARDKLEKIVQSALDKITGAVPNQRQNIILQQSVHLGTWVGSGYLDEKDIKQRILNAVKANLTYKPSDEKERLTAIESGLRFGIGKGKENPKVLQTEKTLQEKLAVEYEVGGRNQFYETSLEEIISVFNTLDDGEANLLKRLFQDKIRHIWEKKDNGWFLYENGIWRETHIEIGRTLARAISSVLNPHYEVVKDEITEYAEIAVERKKQRLKNTGWENAKRNYLEVINDSILEYNKDHYLINCLNGTYDLNTREFREHKPEDKITKQLAVDYDSTAKCPKWEEFLDKVYQGNQEIIRLVQTWLGLNLSGEIIETFLFLWGNGENGKSTIYGTFRDLMGEYAVTMESEAFLANNRDGSHDRIRLLHKRCAIAMEINENTTYDSAKLKAACSQDNIVGENKYENKIEFPPTHKLTIVGNHKPRITDTSDAIARRLVLVPHLWKIPKNEQLPIHEVKKIFWSEMAGILNWAIKGWELFCRQGHKLIIPELVKKATKEYIEDATIQPEIIVFLTECDEVIYEKGNTKHRAYALPLYKTYKRWHSDARRKSTPMSDKAFYKKLKGLELKKEKDSNGHYYLGISILQDRAEFPEREKTIFSIIPEKEPETNKVRKWRRRE